MKTIYKFLSVAALAALVWGCESQDKVTLNPSAIQPAVFTAYPTAEITLDKAQIDGAQAVFAWSPAKYGFASAVTYTLQAYTEGAGGKVVELGQTQNLSLALQNKAFNNALVTGLGATPYDKFTFSVRLLCSLGAQSAAFDTLSTPVVFTVVPFSTEPTPLYVIGQYNDWKHDKDVPIWSELSNGIYTGWVYMNVTTGDNPPAKDAPIEFLFTPKQNWDNKWGSVGGDIAKLVKDGGDNIKIPNGYFYQLTANTKTLVGSIDKKATSIGIIGSAPVGSNWSTDVPLTFDPSDNSFKATLAMQSGAFKLRCDNDWPIQWGAGDADGELKAGGGDVNFTKPAGNYTLKVYIVGKVVPTYEFIAE